MILVVGGDAQSRTGVRWRPREVFTNVETFPSPISYEACTHFIRSLYSSPGYHSEAPSPLKSIHLESQIS